MKGPMTKEEAIQVLAKEFANFYKKEIAMQCKDFATGGKNRQIEQFKERHRPTLKGVTS